MPSYVSSWSRSTQSARSCSNSGRSGRPPVARRIVARSGHTPTVTASHSRPMTRRPRCDATRPRSTNRRCWCRRVSTSRASSLGRDWIVRIRKVRRLLGRERREGPADDLVVDGFIDLERQVQPRGKEPVLFRDVGRTGHQRRVGPNGHDRSLDRMVPRQRRTPRSDDQAVEAGHFERRFGKPATGIDEGIRVEVGRESAEDDAQDHSPSLYPALRPHHKCCTILVHNYSACYGPSLMDEPRTSLISTHTRCACSRIRSGRGCSPLSGIHGPATATALARELDTNTGATSHHLRKLASVGLVEETEDGHGRERWWRASTASARMAGARPRWGSRRRSGMLTGSGGHYFHGFAERYERWLDAALDEPVEWRDALRVGRRRSPCLARATPRVRSGAAGTSRPLSRPIPR